MNPLKPVDINRFRSATARLRHTPEFQTILEYMQQRKEVHKNQLVATRIDSEIPRLQGRVLEIDDLFDEINKTEA